MTDSISFSDAVVALRSFARRYREVLSGPPGDDAWDRLVRRPAAGGRGALDLAAHAADLMEALATTLRTLPTTAHPAVSLPAAASVEAGVSIGDVLGRVARASSAAADALAGRRADDRERPVLIDARAGSVGSLVSLVVTAAAGHLRAARTAIEASR